jgi:Mg-chelatase subunit ChlD
LEPPFEETKATIMSVNANNSAKEDDNEVITMELTPKNDVVGIDSDLATKATVCCTIKVSMLRDESQRAPVDIMVALDISSSMGPDGRLELCKKTLVRLVDCLSTNDRFGLVVFHLSARTQIEPQHMTDENKQKALNIIEALKTETGTNISDAVSMAFDKLALIQDPHMVQSIFLLTDGHPFSGITDPKKLVQFVKEQFSACNASLFCFGVGRKYNDTLLSELSNVTFNGGGYYHLKDNFDVEPAFGDATKGLLSFVAQNVELSLRPQNGAAIAKVRHPAASKQNDESFKINLGALFEDEERDILVDINMALNAVGDTTPISQLAGSLSYMDVIAKTPVQSSWLTASVSRPQSSEVSPDDTHVAVQCLRVVVVDMMDECKRKADQSDLVGARGCLRDAVDLIESADNRGVREHPLVLQLFNDLAKLGDGLSSQPDYRSGGTFAMTSFRTSTWSQRRTHLP